MFVWIGDEARGYTIPAMGNLQSGWRFTPVQSLLSLETICLSNVVNEGSLAHASNRLLWRTACGPARAPTSEYLMQSLELVLFGHSIVWGSGLFAHIGVKTVKYPVLLQIYFPHIPGPLGVTRNSVDARGPRYSDTARPEVRCSDRVCGPH